MKLRYGLLAALMLSLLIGCSRAPVASDSPSAVAEKTPPASPPAAKSKPSSGKSISPPPPQSAPVRSANPAVIKNKEEGILRGIVRWQGPQPLHSTPRLRIHSATQGVAQTAIWLRPLGKTTLAPPAIEPVRLVVERGAYQPHIVLAQKGSTIELRSVEERADFQASGAATFSATVQRGDRRVFVLSSPGLIEVRSQLQPDRAPAYVWVLDGVPGTLTAADGQFRLPPLPPGEYELVLWHEDWHTDEPAPPRTVRVSIKLGTGEGAEVRWTLAEQK